MPRSKYGRINHLIRQLHLRIMQTRRLSRRTMAFSFLLIGAALVSLTSLGFAKLADLAMAQHAYWTQDRLWLALSITPIGLMILAWLTRRYFPYTAGGGIPQVIASLSLPDTADKTASLHFRQLLWKIPLTCAGLLCGVSIGREGPSVQVGAAVMAAWGRWCKKYKLAFRNFKEDDLIAAGAAGGLAAAFNAPLTGVIFAIEELGRKVLIRWDRHVLIGVMASGFILIAIQGNNPYFPQFNNHNQEPNMFAWVLLSALVCGACGGLFALLVSKGLPALLSAPLRSFVRRYPIITAGILGLLIALIGVATHGQTYGAGYQIAANGLSAQPFDILWVTPAKFLATILSVWSGISGGIFTPSLSIGAALGASVWSLGGAQISMDILVLVSMAAFLAATTQSPLTSSVVVMEMTGAQPMLFWILLAAMCASIISRQFCAQPLYLFLSMRFRQQIQEENKIKQE